MGVYTPVDSAALRLLLARYELGSLRDFHGIADGIENTNYFVRTDRTELVLTLFEQLTPAQLPPIFRLLQRLAAHGLPVPHPLPDRQGTLLQTLHGRPALLVPRLAGRSLTAPGPAECAAVGTALAELHRALHGQPALPPNHRGPAWWHRCAAELSGTLHPDARRLLHSELALQRRFRHHTLPRGTIHGDLFRDNVLFDGPQLSGLLDFYAAADDVLLFDVTIAVNDWCRTDDDGLDPARTTALLAAYHAVRPFSGEEGRLWPVLLRAAALRFWLSRLREARHRPAPAKPPQEFERLLRRHRQREPQLAALWHDAIPHNWSGYFVQRINISR